jgi:hypothetical protein
MPALRRAFLCYTFFYMVVLLLIGIFAFAVAMLLRSNEALDRVDAVEKEVSVLEGEVEAKGKEGHLKEK